MDISREELTQKLIDKYGYTKELLDSLNEDDFYEWVERLRDDTIYSIEGIPLDQKAKQDNGKPVFSYVQPALIRADERVRAYGNRKYHDPENWRDVEPQRYWEAVLRHVVAAWDDYRKTDSESGLMHIEHAVCNLGFLLQFIEEGRCE